MTLIFENDQAPEHPLSTLPWSLEQTTHPTNDTDPQALKKGTAQPYLL
jgi:hypothetical protein